MAFFKYIPAETRGLEASILQSLEMPVLICNKREGIEDSITKKK